MKRLGPLCIIFVIFYTLFLTGCIAGRETLVVTATPAPVTPTATPEPLSADLLDSKYADVRAAASPGVGVIFPNSAGALEIRWAKGYVLVTITPSPTVDLNPTVTNAATIPPTNTPRTVTPSETPTATYTPSSTPTRRPTFTKTPTATATEEDNDPTATQEIRPICTGEPIPITNIRLTPNGDVVGTFTAGNVQTLYFDARQYVDSYWWYEFYWSVEYPYTWIRADRITFLDQTDCEKLPASPPELRGIHGLGGFVNAGALLAEIEHYGVLKMTDDAWYMFFFARQDNPNILTIHRNIHLIGQGLKNCPDGYGTGNPGELADRWWNVQVQTWAARDLLSPGLVTWYEVINECGWQSAAWENAFWLRILDLAEARGMCIALYSDSYGTPEIDQFVSRRPVFDRILTGKPCANGKRHIISLHTYGNPSSGAWIFGRWRLFMDALGPKYNALQFAFTEFGVTNQQGTNDGRGSADCGRAAWETWEAIRHYRAHREVIGFMLYSFGSGTEWIDLTPCAQQVGHYRQ